MSTLSGQQVILWYDALDEELATELRVHLTFLETKGLIRLWGPSDLPGGAPRKTAIREQLERAALILPLLSAAFLASDECDAVLDAAVARNQGRRDLIMPVLLQPCMWELSAVRDLEVLPDPARKRPASQWDNRNDAWHTVVRAVLARFGTHAPSAPDAPVITPSPDAYPMLVELLKGLFSADELRHFIRALPGGHEVLAGMPGQNAPPNQQFSAAVDAWIHHGMFDGDLFDRFLAARPRQRERIARARQAVAAQRAGGGGGQGT